MRDLTAPAGVKGRLVGMRPTLPHMSRPKTRMSGKDAGNEVGEQIETNRYVAAVPHGMIRQMARLRSDPAGPARVPGQRPCHHSSPCTVRMLRTVFSMFCFGAPLWQHNLIVDGIEKARRGIVWRIAEGQSIALRFSLGRLTANNLDNGAFRPDRDGPLA